MISSIIAFAIASEWKNLDRKFDRKSNRIGLIDVEKLKVIQSPPFELEHCELELAIRELSIYEGVVDAVLTCCRPRSLSFRSDFSNFASEEWSHAVKFTCSKLLQQEDQGQTNIHFLLSSSSKAEKNISDLNSLLAALPRDPLGQMITFIKEEGLLFQ
ncbi:hypothetical protein Tco_0716806 [Tanacetum coccineum]